jgi:hypothetical protein
LSQYQVGVECLVKWSTRHLVWATVSTLPASSAADLLPRGSDLAGSKACVVGRIRKAERIDGAMEFRMWDRNDFRESAGWIVGDSAVPRPSSLAEVCGIVVGRRVASRPELTGVFIVGLLAPEPREDLPASPSASGHVAPPPSPGTSHPDR